MAIQFHNSAILFDGTSIAMDPACCCGEYPCCNSLPDEWSVDLSNYSSFGNGSQCSGGCCSLLADTFIVGNRVLAQETGCVQQWLGSFCLGVGPCSDESGTFLLPPSATCVDSTSGYCLYVFIQIVYVGSGTYGSYSKGLTVRVSIYGCNQYWFGECHYDRIQEHDRWYVDHDSSCLEDFGEDITLSTNLRAGLSTAIGGGSLCCSGGTAPSSITISKL